MLNTEPVRRIAERKPHLYTQTLERAMVMNIVGIQQLMAAIQP